MRRYGLACANPLTDCQSVTTFLRHLGRRRDFDRYSVVNLGGADTLLPRQVGTGCEPVIQIVKERWRLSPVAFRCLSTASVLHLEEHFRGKDQLGNRSLCGHGSVRGPDARIWNQDALRHREVGLEAAISDSAAALEVRCNRGIGGRLGRKLTRDRRSRGDRKRGTAGHSASYRG